MERAGANELLGSAHSQVRVGRGFASLVRLDCFPQVVVNSCFFRSRVLGLRARRRAGEAAVLPTHSSFAPAAEAAARLCSTPRRSVRGCRRILEEPAPSARRLLFLPTHRALFLTSCRGAEGLAPVALRSRTRSESGERLRISRTPQRNLFRSIPFRFGFSWWRSPILAPKGGVDRCPSLALRSRIAALSFPDRTASAWWRRPWPQSG